MRKLDGWVLGGVALGSPSVYSRVVTRGGHVSKRVSVDIGLDALQEAIGEWPGVGDAAARLGKTPQMIHNMLDEGRLKGIRTRVGWIIHPACVERVVGEEDRSWEEAVESPKEEVGT
jgi:hypothetical protein